MGKNMEKEAFLSKEKPLLIQGAMELEVATLRENMSGLRQKVIGGFTFWTGYFGLQPVVLSQTGIGTAEAAAAAALGCSLFSPCAILNQGTAGAYTADLHPYDVVLAEAVYNANATFTTKEGNILFLNLDALEKETDKKKVTSDQPFLQSMAGPVSTWLEEYCGTYEKGTVHKGLIASGDQWNEDPELLKGYEKFFHVVCEEMEAAAVYAVAKKFGIPFGAVRVISNNNRLGETFVPDTAAALQEWIARVIAKRTLRGKEEKKR